MMKRGPQYDVEVHVPAAALPRPFPTVRVLVVRHNLHPVNQAHQQKPKKNPPSDVSRGAIDGTHTLSVNLR